MKRTICIVFIFSLFMFSIDTVFAECSPGSSWTAAWTDSFNQTSYALEAPCKVYIGIPFTITATVSDAAYPNADVGFGWAIKDNGSVISGGGFNWITTLNGQWQTVIEQTYTGIPIDHVIEFNFSDLGQGAGAHSWASSLVGNVTVDPYPPASNIPPVVEAGPNIFLESKDLSLTSIQGAASDAEGGSLSYRWLEGTAEIQPIQPVDASGNAPLNLAAVSPLSTGSHTLTLEVSDGTASVTDSVVVTVENSTPVSAPAAGGTFLIGEDIRLNGSAADYDGDALSYRWLEGEAVLATGVLPTPSGGTPVPLPECVLTGGLPLGTHTLVLEVNDESHTSAANVVVNVIDTVSPTLAPVASTNILWPPNNRMTEVTIKANARDNSGGPVMLSVIVTTNQPSRTDKHGKVIQDYSVISIDQSTGTVIVELRNAQGEGEDRMYEVTIAAVDASGNSSSAVSTIKAVHDRGKRHNGRGGGDLSGGLRRTRR